MGGHPDLIHAVTPSHMLRCQPDAPIDCTVTLEMMRNVAEMMHQTPSVPTRLSQTWCVQWCRICPQGFSWVGTGWSQTEVVAVPRHLIHTRQAHQVTAAEPYSMQVTLSGLWHTCHTVQTARCLDRLHAWLAVADDNDTARQFSASGSVQAYQERCIASVKALYHSQGVSDTSLVSMKTAPE